MQSVETVRVLISLQVIKLVCKTVRLFLSTLDWHLGGTLHCKRYSARDCWFPFLKCVFLQEFAGSEPMAPWKSPWKRFWGKVAVAEVALVSRSCFSAGRGQYHVAGH